MNAAPNPELDLSRIQALCFDVDGTLSDTDDLLVASLSKWLRYMRHLLPGRDADKVARWMVMRLEGPGNYLYGLPDTFGLDDELYSLLARLPRRAVRGYRFAMVPGADDCLAQLAPHFKMAVVSARPRVSTLAFLEYFELRKHFQWIATALTAERTKPYPDPILWAAEQMGVPPENCLMVGDTTIDIRAGRAAGAQTLGVLSGFGEKHELLTTGAHMILPSVADMPAILLPQGA